MRSHLIENEKIEIPRHEDTKSPRSASFKKSEKKATFPPDLQKEGLAALKEMINEQKSATALLSNDSSKIEVKSLAPSSQVMQLFEKLVNSMTTLNQKGIQETTFFLDSQKFNSSIFQGSKITITEYNTAPKSFNIDLSLSPEAQKVFEAHAADLYTALQRGNFGFTVNRIDTSILTEDKRHPRVERELEKEDSAK